MLDVGTRELRHGDESRDRYDAAVPAYPFLSDEWLAEVRRIVDAQDMEVPSGTNLTMNLLVTETPFPEDRRLNIAMQGGNADWSPGHVDGADLTLTTDYVTAREVLMSGDAQAALQAFMEGKVKIQGDLTKLMAAQASGAAPGGIALAGADRRDHGVGAGSRGNGAGNVTAGRRRRRRRTRPARSVWPRRWARGARGGPPNVRSRFQGRVDRVWSSHHEVVAAFGFLSLAGSPPLTRSRRKTPDDVPCHAADDVIRRST